MFISINLGNLWDILSSLGTITATFIALYLLFDERKKKITGSFIWDVGTQYKPMLMLCNNGTKTISIMQINFTYQGKKYSGNNLSTDWNYEKCRVLLPNDTKRLPIELPVKLYHTLNKFEEQNTFNGRLSDKYKKIANKSRILVVNIIDCTGKKFRIKLKYSHRELLENFCGNWLFDAILSEE